LRLRLSTCVLFWLISLGRWSRSLLATLSASGGRPITLIKTQRQPGWDSPTLRGFRQACKGFRVGFNAERISALCTSGAVRRACYYQGNLFGFQRELYSLYESWRTSKNQKQFQLSAELSCSYGYPPFMSRFGTLFEYTQLELAMFNLIGSRLGEELEVQ
jgi:hypothetical protein